MYKIINFAVLIVIILGCSQTSEIDLSRLQPLITVNSIFNPDSTWQVSVTRSKDVLDNVTGYYYEPVEQAAVSLIAADGNLIEVLHYGLHNGRFIHKSYSKPQIGKRYFLRVKINDLPLTQSSSHIPLPVPVKSILVDSSSLIAGKSYVTIRMRFDDPHEIENFYAIKIIREGYYLNNSDTTTFTEDVSIQPLNPALQGYFSSGTTTVFADNMFQGATQEVWLKVSANTGSQRGDYKIILLTTSKEYFEYFTTKTLQEKNRQDPFAQPVQIFSNIENGVGIFAGYSSSVIALK